MSTTGILGIRIDNLTKAEIEVKISRFLSEDRFHWVVTLNPEIILCAYKDIPFSEILNLSDLNVVDGAGLQYVNLLLGKQVIKTRYPGVDLVELVLRLSWQNKLKVMFFGGREKFSDGKYTSEATREIVQKKFPGINIIIEQGGEISQKDGKVTISDEIIKKINSSGAQVILTALNNPVQEKFLFALKEKTPHIRLAIGVGGSFNLLSGYYKRAPQFLQSLGLEWFWRLWTKPRHLRRVLRAIIIFPSLVVFREFFPRYRQGNMACIINNAGKIFLGQRTRSLPRKVWQMPQGGQEENENGREALLRELKEELGTDKFKIIFKCPETYKYLIKNNFRFSTQGQKLNIWLVQFLGDYKDIKLDKRELVDFQWVDKDKLLQIIDPMRIDSAKICLKYMNKLK